ncbi:hypothetical protein EST38_g12091 [Candolleomyces aberdarensis]|uniref:Uncharacterized protein n=1 Tax=Candolleomyces aberdarensis TaxID=2316362 RepID=A0A4Q2D3B7_9AGAR|nr:hypothetical protein EST38_g12091 [Candolleomyces aberdarensis]
MARIGIRALTLALGSLFALSASAGSTGPNQCISFDASWNLLAFNFDGKDYNAGTQDAFSSASSASATDITTTGRPPFDVPTSSPLCFLSKFANSIYVLNADKSDISSIYIYDATAKSWSKQKTGGAAPKSFDPSSFGGILDHDTNVFYVLSGGEILSLDMALMKAAVPGELTWNDVQKPDLGIEGSGASYEPVLALAQNHVHFLGVPGMPAGEAKVFVIHYSFLQPEAQPYGSFPTAHGKVASFFKDTGVQTQFAYIQDDASSTYVVDVIANTTRTLPGPTTKDPFAQYAASPDSLVQLASEGGKLSFISYNQGSGQAGSWQTISAVPAAKNTPETSGSSAPASSGTNKTSTGSNSTTGTANANSNNNTGTNNSSAAGVTAGRNVVGAMVLGLVLAASGVVGVGL